MPKAALGVLAAAGYRRGRLQLALQGSYFPHSRGELAPVPGFDATGGEFSLRVLALVGCFEPTRARVGLCGGPELSHLRGQGFGVSAPRAGEKSWVSLLLGLRSALHLGSRLWLETAAEVAIPTLREEFALGGVGIVHRPSPAIARASLGLGITL